MPCYNILVIFFIAWSSKISYSEEKRQWSRQMSEQISSKSWGLSGCQSPQAVNIFASDIYRTHFHPSFQEDSVSLRHCPGQLPKLYFTWIVTPRTTVQTTNIRTLPTCTSLQTGGGNRAPPGTTDAWAPPDLQLAFSPLFLGLGFFHYHPCP